MSADYRVTVVTQLTGQSSTQLVSPNWGFEEFLDLTSIELACFKLLADTVRIQRGEDHIFFYRCKNDDTAALSDIEHGCSVPVRTTYYVADYPRGHNRQAC